MKQKKQTEKKLSLRKLQMAKINNPHMIKGGDGSSVCKTTAFFGLDENDGGHTGTRPTK
ncbi:hypothetical protein PGH12_11345 [Chryseobacterium wangxinyae]|uniref:hypothetical protein n=1 Tax=Chryseobacterium sp. CY350 TaxID=2997336 RepID=UPI002271F54B|nr:hypothetical protein [Chryseobacterium sp. CY350]MCY0976335.1 hypothetical protein [Chryseobacterium sp. CY350]WBZ94067.1 hypothetical protein PGH12_11345 [Chryseobacterium sp. CY350]